MNKLIYRKLATDVLSFFIVASLSITLIVWVIQAVNFLDIVSEDGHSLKVYFSYTILNLPRIFSKILIFIFFISAFYIINKYEECIAAYSSPNPIFGAIDSKAALPHFEVARDDLGTPGLVRPKSGSGAIRSDGISEKISSVKFCARSRIEFCVSDTF